MGYIPALRPFTVSIERLPIKRAPMPFTELPISSSSSTMENIDNGASISKRRNKILSASDAQIKNRDIFVSERGKSHVLATADQNGKSLNEVHAEKEVQHEKRVQFKLPTVPSVKTDSLNAPKKHSKQFMNAETRLALADIARATSARNEVSYCMAQNKHMGNQIRNSSNVHFPIGNIFS